MAKSIGSVEGRTWPKIFSFSLIERVILSAGAMLIFSVSFQIDQMPEGENNSNLSYIYLYCCFVVSGPNGS